MELIRFGVHVVLLRRALLPNIPNIFVQVTKISFPIECKKDEELANRSISVEQRDVSSTHTTMLLCFRSINVCNS